MDSSNGPYIAEWTSNDMIAFNGFVIDEKEVTCRWVDNWTLCNDLVKAKNFKAHLHHKHGVTSDSQHYPCRWHQCSSQPMRRSSLERHVKEQHVPVRWACPHCTQTFTRESTLVSHVEQSH